MDFGLPLPVPFLYRAVVALALSYGTRQQFSCKGMTSVVFQCALWGSIPTISVMEHRVCHTTTPTVNSNLGIAHIGDTISSVEIPNSIISLWFMRRCVQCCDTETRPCVSELQRWRAEPTNISNLSFKFWHRDWQRKGSGRVLGVGACNTL